MVKLFCANYAWINSDISLQIHGSYGYAQEYEISRILCDSRIMSIFEGTSEIQAGIIAKEICKRGVKVAIKPDKSPVTDGDLAVDKILKAKIQNLTPHITIISEETVNINDDNKNQDFWLIDPIDGTKDYIKKKMSIP